MIEPSKAGRARQTVEANGCADGWVPRVDSTRSPYKGPIALSLDRAKAVLGAVGCSAATLGSTGTNLLIGVGKTIVRKAGKGRGVIRSEERCEKNYNENRSLH